MSQPLFSILTSAHQNEQYLSEMIDSVRRQTIGEWELIISSRHPMRQCGSLRATARTNAYG